MAEMRGLDEDAAVNERSAVTLSRGNDAAIQINCAGEEGRKEGRKEGRREGGREQRGEKSDNDVEL